MLSRGVMMIVAALLLAAPHSLEAFQVGTLATLSARGTPALSLSSPPPSCARKSGLQLRMSSSPPESPKEEEAAAEDPYEVKPEVPGFAKVENQWAIDTKEASAKDSEKKTLAIVSGAVALVLSVAYLAAVVALESRGPLKPPPPEALIGAVTHAATLLG